ncbi:MAG: peptidoglycan-binding protein [Candidatus Sungbacteria bacterium]|nr:peptidoglycan-binding protein [Candidatus Sungbacteria bacterium]
MSITGGAALFGFLAAASAVHAAAPTVSSAKITGPQTVTIVYSESVNTSQGDYSNFNGILGSRNLTGLAGSGSAAIGLTFDGPAFAPDAGNGGMTIATTTASVSDHTTFGGGSISVSDGQIPMLTSIAVSSAGSGLPLAKMGGSVVLTLSANEAITSPTVTVLGHAIAAIGGSFGPYTVNYIMSNGDQEGTVPATIAITDLAGNTGKVTLSFTNTNGVVPVPVAVPAAVPPPPAPVPAPAPVVAPSSDQQYQALLKELEEKKSQLAQAAAIPQATPALPASVKFTRALSIGSVGDDVRELQQRLADEGVYRGAITGRFGAQTRDALKTYQKKHRLAPLGTVGPGTRALLNR